MTDKKITLSWFLDYVGQNSPDPKHKTMATAALTQLKAFQSGQVDTKHHASVKLRLLAQVGMLVGAYGMIGKTPEELLAEEGV